MSNTSTLLERNQSFAASFAEADLSVFPKLNTMILTCMDARVDPAHIFNLDLGEAVVVRNTGGRVTPAVIDEIAALSVMINQMNGGQDTPFDLILMQHTHCGSERLADPNLAGAIKSKTGVDVAPLAIHDHEESLREDLEALRNSPAVPDYLTVSTMIYDVKTGLVSTLTAPARLN
jgi:carbonic anhydrase